MGQQVAFEIVLSFQPHQDCNFWPKTYVKIRVYQLTLILWKINPTWERTLKIYSAESWRTCSRQSCQSEPMTRVSWRRVKVSPRPDITKTGGIARSKQICVLLRYFCSGSWLAFSADVCFSLFLRALVNVLIAPMNLSSTL